MQATELLDGLRRRSHRLLCPQVISTRIFANLSKYNIGCISTEDHPMEVLLRRLSSFTGAACKCIDTKDGIHACHRDTSDTIFICRPQLSEAKALVEIGYVFTVAVHSSGRYELALEK